MINLIVGAVNDAASFVFTAAPIEDVFHRPLREMQRVTRDEVLPSRQCASGLRAVIERQ
jgi:hypothetical protein